MTGRSQRQFVFVCGCSRSGTSTLADLLRSHTSVAMGRERYAVRFRKREPFSEELFELERFCRELKDGDTHHQSLDAYYEELSNRYDRCTHVGDKIPKIYEDYDFWRQSFPGAKFVFLVRNAFDVAQSFEGRAALTKAQGGAWPVTRGYGQAVDEWNLSLRNTLRDRHLGDVLVVEYESLYVDDAVLEQLFSFIGLPVTTDVREYWGRAGEVRAKLESARTLTLDSQQKRHIASHARFELYRALLGEDLGEGSTAHRLRRPPLS